AKSKCTLRKPNPPPFEAPPRNAPHPRRAQADRPRRVPAVPRSQAAPRRLLELRLLPRTPGQGARGVSADWRRATGNRPLDTGNWPQATDMGIAIDAMGGDIGPSVTVDGALVAARHLQVALLLVGDRAAIESELARHPAATLFRRIDIQIAD